MTFDLQGVQKQLQLDYLDPGVTLHLTPWPLPIRGESTHWIQCPLIQISSCSTDSDLTQWAGRLTSWLACFLRRRCFKRKESGGSLEVVCSSPLTAVWKQLLPTRTFGLSPSRHLMKPESISVNVVFIILPLIGFFFSRSEWVFKNNFPELMLSSTSSLWFQQQAVLCVPPAWWIRFVSLQRWRAISRHRQCHTTKMRN